MAEIGIEKIKDKLNAMFDVDGGVITKTQYCPAGRWGFTLGMSLFFAAIYAVLVLFLNRLYGSLYWFVFCLLTAALIYFEIRLWFAFALDFKSQKFAERTLFWKRGDDRLYYSRGRYVSKLEYESGGIEAGNGGYDRFEDKANYSPFAGRYNKALQRRSSLYSTMTPSFWFGILCDMSCFVTENGIAGVGRGIRVEFVCDSAGKISEIRYAGNGYYLFDSVSPIKIFNAKIPGKYKITYKFQTGNTGTIFADEIFGNAVKDFLWTPPSSEAVKFVSPVPFTQWLKQTDEKIAALKAAKASGAEVAAARGSAAEIANGVLKAEFSEKLRKNAAVPNEFDKANEFKNAEKNAAMKSFSARLNAEKSLSDSEAEANARDYSVLDVNKCGIADLRHENEKNSLSSLHGQKTEEKFFAGKVNKRGGKR